MKARLIFAAVNVALVLPTIAAFLKPKHTWTDGH